MKNVVFVAPYFLEATGRFVQAAARLPEARVGLVTCDPLEKFPPAVAAGLAGHFRIDSLATDEIARGVRAMAVHLGSADRLIGMLEQIQVPLGEIRDRFGIPGMGAEAAANFRDKDRMKRVLREAGIPCARARLVHSPDEGIAFAREHGFPVVAKPPDGAGAKGTFRCEHADHLLDCLQTLGASPEQPVLLEEFIQGREHSFDSVCIRGQVVWSSISHYFPGPLEVVREPWIQWCVIIPRESDAPRYNTIRRVAPAALEALGMQTGLSHMEWFLRDDGSIAISEVGARPPGAQFTSLISWAHDFNLYDGWAHLMIHDRFYVPERKYAAGAAYLRGMGRGHVRRVLGIEEVLSRLGDLVVEKRLPQAGQAASGSYEGEGCIIVRHSETRVVERALDEIINHVRVELGEPAQ